MRSDSGHILLDKFLYSRHLLRAGAVREPWVGFEGDHLRVDYGFELFCRHATKPHWDHAVHLTVALQDGEVLVAAGSRWETPVERQPAAEGHDAGQLMLAGQGGVQGQGSTLREATEHYTVWGDPIFHLMFDYGLDVVCCLLDSRFILRGVGTETL